MSGGKFEIKFFEPGALIPPLECFDAVSKGSIESCWTTPGYHTGKYPVLAFFTTVPFGPFNMSATSVVVRPSVLLSSTFKITSPGRMPARYAGEPTNGASTTVRPSRGTTDMPTP